MFVVVDVLLFCDARLGRRQIPQRRPMPLRRLRERLHQSLRWETTNSRLQQRYALPSLTIYFFLSSLFLSSSLPYFFLPLFPISFFLSSLFLSSSLPYFLLPLFPIPLSIPSQFCSFLSSFPILLPPNQVALMMLADIGYDLRRLLDLHFTATPIHFSCISVQACHH